MRLTNDGIKPGEAGRFDTWFTNAPGSKTQSAEEMQNDRDARTPSEGIIVAAANGTSDLEVQYAMATAGYEPTVSELGGLMLRLPEQFESAQVKSPVEYAGSLAVLAQLEIGQVAAYDDQIAA